MVLLYLTRHVAGSLSFDRIVVSDATLGCWSVHVADVNGDGRLDILSASTSGSSNLVMLHKNEGVDVFLPEVISNSVLGPRHVTTADVDGDGDLVSPDIACFRLILFAPASQEESTPCCRGGGLGTQLTRLSFVLPLSLPPLGCCLCQPRRRHVHLL